MREIFSRTAALDLTRIRTSAVNTNFGARLFEIRALFLFPKALFDFYAEPGCDRQKNHARRNTYRSSSAAAFSDAVRMVAARAAALLAVFTAVLHAVTHGICPLRNGIALRKANIIEKHLRINAKDCLNRAEIRQKNVKILRIKYAFTM